MGLGFVKRRLQEITDGLLELAQLEEAVQDLVLRERPQHGSSLLGVGCRAGAGIADSTGRWCHRKAPRPIRARLHHR